METSLRSRVLRSNALGVWILFLVPVVALQAFSQDIAKPESGTVPAPSAPSLTAPPETGLTIPATESEGPAHTEPGDAGESVVDLRTLVLREQLNVPKSERGTGSAALSIRGKDDGTVEVRDAAGKLLEEYPPNYFSISGKVSAEAIEGMNAFEEVQAEELSARKGKEQEDIEKELEASKEAEARAKEIEKANEVKWQEDFKANAAPYLDRKTKSKLNAVKIDAREIREDGTYVYEGKALKPIRLFSTERKRYEMAIPIPSPTE